MAGLGRPGGKDGTVCRYFWVNSGPPPQKIISSGPSAITRETRSWCALLEQHVLRFKWCVARIVAQWHAPPCPLSPLLVYCGRSRAFLHEQAGHRTCVIDFDIGLRNMDLHLGCERRVIFDFVNVIQVLVVRAGHRLRCGGGSAAVHDAAAAGAETVPLLRVICRAMCSRSRPSRSSFPQVYTE